MLLKGAQLFSSSYYKIHFYCCYMQKKHHKNFTGLHVHKFTSLQIEAIVIVPLLFKCTAYLYGMQKVQKPAEGEYRDYTAAYISKVPDDGMVLQHLQTNFEALKSLVIDLPEEKLLSAYAPGKWTLKEMLVHMMDTERIMAYRALRVARNDKTNLPGFEQDDYTPYLYANERSIANIMEEYELLRKSTVALFNNFDESAFARVGFANSALFSVRAALYIIAGHELHHSQIIEEKYL